MYFISVTAKLKFQIITPVFIVTWSFRNQSDMLISSLRNFFLFINAENSLLLNIFVETVKYFCNILW